MPVIEVVCVPKQRKTKGLEVKEMHEKISLALVKTGKLSVDQMLEIGNKANDSDVWQAVVKQIE